MHVSHKCDDSDVLLLNSRNLRSINCFLPPVQYQVPVVYRMVHVFNCIQHGWFHSVELIPVWIKLSTHVIFIEEGFYFFFFFFLSTSSVFLHESLLTLCNRALLSSKVAIGRNGQHPHFLKEYSYVPLLGLQTMFGRGS